MIKVSEAATLALHAAAYLSMSAGRKVSTREIASELGASEAHLAKILQRLEHAGLVKGRRGPAGGFEMGREPGTLTLLEIYETVEGPIMHTCLLGQPQCTPACPLGGLVKTLSQQARRELANIRVTDFARLWGKRKGGVRHANPKNH